MESLSPTAMAVTSPSIPEAEIVTQIMRNVSTGSISNKTATFCVTAPPTDMLVCHLPRPGENCLFYSFVVNFIFIGTLCVFGLLGNVLAFVVFCLDPVKTPTAFLFQTLSVVDSLLLLCSFPIYSLEAFASYTGFLVTYKTHYHPFLLVVLVPCAFVAQTSTIWLTVFVALIRYLAVCKPHDTYRFCTEKNTPINFTLLIIFCVVYNIPRFIESRVKESVDCTSGRTFFKPVAAGLGESDSYKYVYKNVLYLIFLFILPLFILLILSYRLIMALKDFRRRRATMRFSSSNSSSNLSQDNGATVVLIAVVLVFFCCQTPALANQILWTILPNCLRRCGGFQHYFSRLSNALVILNSAVNFLVYYSVNARFKQTFLEKVLRRPQQRSINTQRDLTALVLLRNGTRQCSATALTSVNGNNIRRPTQTLVYPSENVPTTIVE